MISDVVLHMPMSLQLHCEGAFEDRPGLFFSLFLTGLRSLQVVYHKKNSMGLYSYVAS